MVAVFLLIKYTVYAKKVELTALYYGSTCGLNRNRRYMQMIYSKLDESNAIFLTKIFSNPEYELYFAENDTTEEEWKERLACYVDKESYIVYNDTSPVGWVMYKVEGTTCYVDIIVLLDENRRKGYGYDIIHDIIEKNKEIKTIKLDVQKRNNGACKFYKKLGFRVVCEEQQPIQDGMTDYYNLQLDIVGDGNS